MFFLCGGTEPLLHVYTLGSCIVVPVYVSNPPDSFFRSLSHTRSHISVFFSLSPSLISYTPTRAHAPFGHCLKDKSGFLLSFFPLSADKQERKKLCGRRRRGEEEEKWVVGKKEEVMVEHVGTVSGGVVQDSPGVQTAGLHSPRVVHGAPYVHQLHISLLDSTGSPLLLVFVLLLSARLLVSAFDNSRTELCQVHVSPR